MQTVKKQAEELIKNLPEDVTWEELAHKIYVRHSIEKGLDAAREGRRHTPEEVRQRLGLEK